MQLAIQAKSSTTLIQHPSQDVVDAMANKVNGKALPSFKPGVHGLRLPQDQDQAVLLSTNWNINVDSLR